MDPYQEKGKRDAINTMIVSIIINLESITKYFRHTKGEESLEPLVLELSDIKMEDFYYICDMKGLTPEHFYKAYLYMTKKDISIFQISELDDIYIYIYNT